MRILHVLDHSLPLHSGYAFRTAAILREQHAQGYETLQLTTPRQNGGSATEADVDSLRFHRTPLAPGSADAMPGGRYLREMAATARRLDELVTQWRPDVVHAHSPVLDALPARRVARRHGIPMVYEVRALWEDAAVDHGTTREGSLRYRASRALETWVLRRADHVTTICEGLRREIVARGVPERRVTVIPNAVDPREFTIGVPADAALRAKLGLAGKRVIGFAGSFYGYEGLDLLVDAFAKLARGSPDLALMLVGGGPQEKALRVQAAALGLASRVIFTGRVPHSEVQRYYELIDVLAYPRRSMRLTELVTPLKPLEAMAQGRMFVASDVGGHRELVRDGETGFLFKAGDVDALAARIAAVLDDESSWPRIARAGRRFVESERTWSANVRRYRDVYAAVTANTTIAAVTPGAADRTSATKNAAGAPVPQRARTR
ncbi:MAG TPA: TIGR04063 family PEP-CTERM/XrtA system glycosyltransferase [Casimicrobiaceae bacterium]|nr:TIGR04063 family PEP-CTERM/XrtA system glycosyltransferase [Casimicrobiaceae bacterium]